MKHFLLALCATVLSTLVFAQTDSTKNEAADTIKVGGIIIIKKGDGRDSTRRREDRDINITFGKRQPRKPSNVTTNWGVVDLGFSNYTDRTHYASADVQQMVPGATSKDALELRTGKSNNVNIWFFMQKLNMIKHAVNLKYGLGLELNNYTYDRDLMFEKNPTRILPANTDIKKGKLAADYVTLPMMVNFNFTPKREKGFGISGGVSAGYLYSARFKSKNGDKTKVRDNFDLEKFKLSYIGELNMGIITLYGSYAFKNMWEKTLDQQPYNFGVRLSHW